MIHLSHELMEYLIPFFEFLVLVLNLLSIFILLWGIAIVVYDFITSECKTKDRILLAQQNTFIKGYFGSYVLLSLEILIAADIMESILNPTFSDIARLAAIVIIRTLISYFLNQEIKEAILHDDLHPHVTTLGKKEKL